jgi:hypothetical protein
MSVRYATLFNLALSASLCLTPAFAEDAKEDTEAMELGGLLTVDGGNQFKDWESTPARLGRVELSANVHVEKDLEGSITLLSENDPGKISVDQAVGQWTLPQAKVIFGQQGFNLGLASTRTNSDPLLLDLAGYHQAGLTLLWSKEAMTYGFGLSSLETAGSDSVMTSDPCVVLNADFAPEGQMARLSLQASRARQAVDAAVNLTHGPLLLDVEALWRWKDEDDVAKGGYSAGIAWQITPMFQPAFRWDALGDEEEMLQDQLYTVGITITPVEHVFGAGNVSFDQDGHAFFAVQMGLQSTLKLPGFQRKTLTR